MSSRAYVLPADATQPGRMVSWDKPSELLSLMYREIGTDCVDCGPCCETSLGDFVIWVSDDGLLAEQPEYNDHAIGIARGAGWNVPMLAGTAFITGGYTPDGETLGLSEALLQHIDSTVRCVRQQGNER